MSPSPLAGALLLTAVGIATGPSASAADGGAVARIPATAPSAMADAMVPAPVPRVVPPLPRHTTLTPGESRTEIDVKLREGSSLRLRGGRLAVVDTDGTRRTASASGRAGASELTSLERIVGAPGRSIRRLFAVPEAAVDAVVRSAQESSRREQADLNLWHRVTLPAGSDVEAVLDALNGLAVVEVSTAAPLSAPPPVSPDCRSRQGYHSPATASGIGANYAWTVAGGSGQNVRIHDVEYSWNGTHEDLTKLRTAYYPNGTLATTFSADHGTAVAGEISGDANAFGVTGLVRGVPPT